MKNKYVTVTVWNATVANLTLMALGSSAPEILLNVIDIFASGFMTGALGPFTIVGSAAFNLLCITAVCVVAIPGGETRIIKEFEVYVITAVFSVFAYLWLLVILMGTSENLVDVWEGVLTFLFFPVLVELAFLADKGYFSKNGGTGAGKQRVVTADMTKEELADVEATVRKLHGAHLTDEQVLKIIEIEYSPPAAAPPSASPRRAP
jgi:solute carrier family 8 (sodium/calcium exchanger)